MDKKIKNYISHCIECQMKKMRHPDAAVPGIKRNVVPAAWHTVSIDFIENLPTTSNGMNNVLVLKDNFTRYSIAVPTKTKSAIEAAKAYVENVI